MSMEITAAVLKCKAIDPLDKLLLLSIAESASLPDEENTIVFDKIPSIAARANMSLNEALTRIRRLMDERIILLDYNERIAKLTARLQLPEWKIEWRKEVVRDGEAS